MKEKLKVGYIDPDGSYRNIFYQSTKNYLHPYMFFLYGQPSIDELISKILISDINSLVIDLEMNSTGLVDYTGVHLMQSLEPLMKDKPIFIVGFDKKEAKGYVIDMKKFISKDLFTTEEGGKLLEIKIKKELKKYYEKKI